MPPTTAPTSTGSGRVPLWDHARFFLLYMIVIGHLLEPLRTGSRGAYLTYVFLYFFHVAALLAISGFFSKPHLDRRNVASIIQLIVIWLMWEAIFVVFSHYIKDSPLSIEGIMSPSWGLWFLLTLATQRVLLPIIANLRYPFLTSVALALGAGLIPAIGMDFSASRSLFFLPFFVAGWLAKERGWAKQEWFLSPSRGLRAGAVGVFVVVAGALLTQPDLEETWRVDRWVMGRQGYADLLTPGSPTTLDFLRPLGVGTNPYLTDFVGLLIRAGVMGVGAAMTVALLILVPRRTIGGAAVARMLPRTLYVYLLHLLIVSCMRPFDVVPTIGELGLPGLFVIFLLAAVLTIGLSTDVVAKVARPIIEPSVDWLMRREHEPASGDSPTRAEAKGRP